MGWSETMNNKEMKWRINQSMTRRNGEEWKKNLEISGDILFFFFLMLLLVCSSRDSTPAASFGIFTIIARNWKLGFLQVLQLVSFPQSPYLALSSIYPQPRRECWDGHTQKKMVWFKAAKQSFCIAIYKVGLYCYLESSSNKKALLSALLESSVISTFMLEITCSWTLVVLFRAKAYKSG